jgi:phosphate-selective porin OprO/OprP
LVVGNAGLIASSADTNFVFKLNGVLQVDNRTFFNESHVKGNDGFILRRARPIFSGTLYRDFDFMFVPDFGGSSVQIVDAYINYRYQPWLQLRAGKFKVPVGLEHLQSDCYTFFSERSIVTSLVPNRDVGFQLWGDVADGRVSYAAGVFNGVGDGRSSANSDFEDHREFAGRLFATPFKKSDNRWLSGIGFGVGGSWGNVSSNATGLPSGNGYATDGQQQYFSYTNGVVANGNHWRVSPQAYYYAGPFGLLAEYAVSHQEVSRGALGADLQHTAWQIAAGWVLTGEDCTFAGVNPKKPFDPRAGQWGALQLVARYAELNIDDDAFPTFSNPNAAASGAQSWSLGLNWYLNRNIRVNTSFARTTFDGGGSGASTTAPGNVTRQPENVVFSRLQLAF